MFCSTVITGVVCAVSGVAPEDPVICTKSGHLYERRLLLAHMSATGTEPITGDIITDADIIPVKSSKLVKPRVSTSLPSLLSSMSSEWESICLESFALKQALETTRQELSQALYQHDAACRVIARLLRERDAARAALTAAQSALAQRNVTEATGSTAADSNSTATTTASGEIGLTAELSTALKDKHKELSRARKKRVVKDTVATPEQLQSLTNKHTYTPHAVNPPGITALAVHPDASKQNLVLTGGADKNVLLFDVSAGRVVGRCGNSATATPHTKKVTAVAFHPYRDVLLSASADASVHVWSNVSVPRQELQGDYQVATSIRAHTKAVSALAMHPLGDYVLTLARDATVAFSDIASGKVVSLLSSSAATSPYECGACHPDGILAIGGAEDGVVRVWDIREGKIAAELTGHAGSVGSIAMSENGYYLASGAEDNTVRLWDLRKVECFHTIATPAAASSVTFDYSGLYLAAGLANGVTQIWGTNKWDQVLESPFHNAAVTGLQFAQDSHVLYSASMDRTLKVFGTA